MSYIISACYGAVVGLMLIIVCSKYEDITEDAVFLVSTWVSTILGVTFFIELLLTSNIWYLLLTAIFIAIFLYTTLTNLDKCFDLREEYDMLEKEI